MLTKVNEPDSAVVSHENVLSLDVSVQDIVSVQIVQAGQDLPEDVGD